MLDEDERDKDKNDYTGNQQSFDRINHFLQIQKEKMEKGEEPEKIKEEIAEWNELINQIDEDLSSRK
jgi:hypothetical protein